MNFTVARLYRCLMSVEMGHQIAPYDARGEGPQFEALFFFGFELIYLQIIKIFTEPNLKKKSDSRQEIGDTRVLVLSLSYQTYFSCVQPKMNIDRVIHYVPLRLTQNKRYKKLF